MAPESRNSGVRSEVDFLATIINEHVPVTMGYHGSIMHYFRDNSRLVI
jgi:hypothetical protein